MAKERSPGISTAGCSAAMREPSRMVRSLAMAGSPGPAVPASKVSFPARVSLRFRVGRRSTQCRSKKPLVGVSSRPPLDADGAAHVPQPPRLKNCTARSCFSAACRLLNVPRFRRLPVFGFFLREYKRYWPDLSFLIINCSELSYSQHVNGPAGLRLPRGSASPRDFWESPFILLLEGPDSI